MDLATAARVARASVAGIPIPLERAVDDVVFLREFNVVANEKFVSLVVAGVDELSTAIRDSGQRLDTLREAIPVTCVPAHAVRELSDVATAAGLTVLVSTELDLVLLHAQLTTALAIDRAAEARLITAGTRVLTQVARRGGIEAMIVELAHQLNGWCVLLDNHGRTITSAGAGALHLEDAASAAMNRATRVRHPGLQVHRVGEANDLRAFLVVASRDGATSRTRDLAAQASALLDLLVHTHEHSVTERLGRELLVRSVLCDAPSSPEILLKQWDVRDETLTGFVISARTRVVEVERKVLRWLDELGAVHTILTEKDRVVGLISDDLVAEFATRVESTLVEAGVMLRCGFGSSAPLSRLRASIVEARQAHESAVLRGHAVVHYSAIPTVQLILDALEGDQLIRLMKPLAALRSPALDDHLVETLRIYLAEHGSWGVAAERLGVHRHTLKNRITRIEELTGLSLDDPDDRFAAWIALRALGAASEC